MQSDKPVESGKKGSLLSGRLLFSKCQSGAGTEGFFPGRFLPFILAAGLWGGMVALGRYRCPLDYFLGIPCPLCGITRAFLALLKGDVAGAFYYHPLWPVFLAAVILLLLYSFNIIRPSKAVFNAFCFLLALLFLVCYVIRHIQASPIVQPHFTDSFLYWVIGL